MTDEELAAQSPTLPTMYFDGFGNYQRINGVLRCIGYVLHAGPNLNLVISLVGAEQAQQDTERALHEKETQRVISGLARHH